jgi:hypothetical protein
MVAAAYPIIGYFASTKNCYLGALVACDARDAIPSKRAA